MDHFTAHHDPLIDTKIREDLSVIVDRVTGAVDDVVAIVLLGGFARGEGTIVRVDDRVVAYNDYDLLVVRSKAAGRRVASVLRALGERLAAELGIRFVELLPRASSDLVDPDPTQFNYDLQQAHRVVWGDADVITRARPIAPEQIDHEEARVSLFNRMVCMLEAIEMSRDGCVVGNRDPFFALYQTAKAVFTLADARLIVSGAYDSDTDTKRERLSRIDAAQPTLELFERAIAIKRFADTSHSDPGDYWNAVCRCYVRAFAEFVGVDVRDRGGWIRYIAEHAAGRGVRARLRAGVGGALRRAVGTSSAAGAAAAPLAVLLAIGVEDGLDPDWIAYGEKLYGIEASRDSPFARWDRLRARSVGMWYRYCH